MNLILCCGNDTLRQRWFSALHDLFTTYEASTLQDLRILVGQRIVFDTLLVHGSLVDRDSVAYIRKRRPACKLFILSDRPDDNEGLTYLHLGTVGYANSYISQDRLRGAVQAIAAGSVWVNQQLLQRLIAGKLTASAPPSPPAPQDHRSPVLAALSTREQQIAQLVSQGLSNPQIAQQLGITERTVKAHLSTAYGKTSVRGRLALALLLRQHE